MPGFSPLHYMLTSCVLHVCDKSHPTHGEGEDNFKSVETNGFEQVVLKLENN